MIAATKARWTRGTVHYLLKNWASDPRTYTRLDDEGYISGNIGLYREPGKTDWNVQHHPSGWHIGQFGRKRDAQEAIATLRAEFDFAMLDRYATNTQEPQDWDNGQAFRKRFHQLRDATDAR